jgi:hypothetical protein
MTIQIQRVTAIFLLLHWHFRHIIHTHFTGHHFIIDGFGRSDLYAFVGVTYQYRPFFYLVKLLK